MPLRIIIIFVLHYNDITIQLFFISRCSKAEQHIFSLREDEEDDKGDMEKGDYPYTLYSSSTGLQQRRAPVHPPPLLLPSFPPVPLCRIAHHFLVYEHNYTYVTAMETT